VKKIDNWFKEAEERYSKMNSEEKREIRKLYQFVVFVSMIENMSS
jgi:hypothetical protein